MYRHAFNKSPRCQYRTPSGKRCRFNASNPDSDFCDNHATPAENRQEAADLSAVLTANLTEFKSPAAINDFLSRLLLLLSQDRISARRAAVLAYITNQLLRTVTVMDQQTAVPPDPKTPRVNIIWDLPRPAHENIGLPLHAQPASPHAQTSTAAATRP